MTIDPNGMLVQGIILGTGIMGQLFVSQMKYEGFYFWLVCNVVLGAVSFYFGSYGMVCLYTFYGVMSVYSIYKWKVIQSSKSPA